MAFQPAVGQALIVDGVQYWIAEHPAARFMPYGQEGRQATVYQVVSEQGEKQALKVFKPHYRLPTMVGLAGKLSPFAKLTGLRVCRRAVLTPQRNENLLKEHHDLLYAVLMSWVEGTTWMEVILDGQDLPPRQCLGLSRSLARVLAAMEQQGLAHCDLSGSNVMIPAVPEIDPAEGRPAIELVDVEGLYAPGLDRPRDLLAGSPGYAHRAASEGSWTPEADRFAGAVLLAEMLGWCDERVRAAAWGESFFAPDETQEPCDRYRLLASVLRERWGEQLSALFRQAWCSETLADCPTFSEWLVLVPAEDLVLTPQGQDGSVLEPREWSAKVPQGRDARVDLFASAGAPIPGAAHSGPEEMEREVLDLERAGNWQEAKDIYSRLWSQASIQEERWRWERVRNRCQDEEILARLFDAGVRAYHRGELRAARELLGEVARRRPTYARDGIEVGSLLEKMLELRSPPDESSPWPRRGLLTTLGLVSVIAVLLFLQGALAGRGLLGSLFWTDTPAPPVTLTAMPSTTHTRELSSPTSTIAAQNAPTASIPSVQPALPPPATLTPVPALEAKIVFSAAKQDSQPDIYTMNPDGSGVIQLTFDPGYDSGPDWSPDGKLVAFHSNRSGNYDIYVVDRTGERVWVQQLTSHRGNDYDPSWSPDGSQIVFMSDRDGNREIYVMNSNGSSQRRLTFTTDGRGAPDSERQPAWSPQGGEIVFESSRTGARQIYLMDSNGDGQYSLTNSQGANFSPKWSPDGQRIVFASTRDPGSKENKWAEIYVLDLSRSTTARLTVNSADDEAPAWSPDGHRIVFASKRDTCPNVREDGDCDWELYTMSIDGSGVRRLTQTSNFSEYNPMWWAP